MRRGLRLDWGWLAVACLVAACSGDGGSGSVTMPVRACASGETRVCACAGGVMGAQSCLADGSGFGACGDCAQATRCGDGTCNGGEMCSTCPSDCMCAARCGDGMCNGTETCRSCAGDCGACPVEPRCGDGTCNGAETCRTCADDCGACPARCGDGTCNGTETCTSCTADCGACETMCQACSQNADCPAGSFCGPRRCDGARGCYPMNDAAASCARIGGERCPSTAAYNLCIADMECGPFAGCQRYGDGRSFCARRCSLDLDCPTPPSDSTTRARCASNTRTCYLECSGPGTCPYGLSCFRFESGTYGYCS